MPIGAAAGAGAFDAQMREEQLGSHDLSSLGDWEFKILTGHFGTRDRMERALADESQFGWELHEKLCNMRLRLRRRIVHRIADGQREGDPYRSHAENYAIQTALILGICLAAGVG